MLDRRENISHMQGNGFKTLSMDDRTITLGLINPSQTGLLSERENALDRLNGCYEAEGRIKIPRVISSSPDDGSITVEKAQGFSLHSITKDEQLALDERDVYERVSFIIEFLTGIQTLNRHGFVFGDYNATTFHFELERNLLWIIDPGVSELASSGYSGKIENAGEEEVNIAFRTNAFINLLETLGLPFKIKQGVIRKQKEGSLKDMESIIQYIRKETVKLLDE